MHDPLVVAFEIRRPWPHRSSFGWYWPPVITIWHREPGGRDSGEVCKHYDRWEDEDGTWRWKIRHGWRFHVHHWKIQVHPLQELRRWLLTRCAWCKGKHRKGDPVNFSHSWDGPRGRWWRGEPGLYHEDCSAVASAHRACVCEQPVTEYDGYGRCARCTRYRQYGAKPEQIARWRELAAIGKGCRGLAVGEESPDG